MPRKTAILAGLFLVSLLLRLLWVLQILPDRQRVMGGDGEDYYELAMNVARGRGMVARPLTTGADTDSGARLVATARRPPLYPLFAAAVMSLGVPFLGGRAYEHYETVVVFQAVLDACTTLLVFALAREWAGGWRAGLAAAAAYALNFYVIQFVSEFMTEALFFFLQTLGLLLLAWTVRAESPCATRAALAGAVLGLATLARPVPLLFAPLAAAWLFLSLRGWAGARRATLAAVLFLLAFALTLLPWSARNRAVLGKWVPVSTIGGQTLYYSSHETSGGRWTPLPLPPEAQNLSEVELEAYYYRKTWEFMSAHPAAALRNAVFKFFQFYYVFYPEYDFFFGITFFLAVPGAWLYFRGDGRNWLPLGLIVYSTLLGMVFLGIPRYRAPLLPCFLVYAGYYAGSFLWPEIEKPDGRHLLYAAAVLAANGLLVVFAEPVRALLKSL
ncbi:MAG: glycosyltransferase family 39 protein [Planctomycetes bacterium]|nr:glycosyltransferase family 39 protein [Planctomycetota bacterium]